MSDEKRELSDSEMEKVAGGISAAALPGENLPYGCSSFSRDNEKMEMFWNFYSSGKRCYACRYGRAAGSRRTEEDGGATVITFDHVICEKASS